MTTLTKARFFEQTKTKVVLYKEVPGYGDVWIRDQPEVQRTRRFASMFDAGGNRIPQAAARRRIHEVIDQVCEDESGTPMFTEADLKDLEQVAGSKLDGLYAVIAKHNRADEKKDEAGSEDTNKS